MAIGLKDAETDRLAREVAALTGEIIDYDEFDVPWRLIAVHRPSPEAAKRWDDTVAGGGGGW